jgi:hypothetical protein
VQTTCRKIPGAPSGPGATPGSMITNWIRNVRKRAIKAPKLHFIDSGLACHLLGIREPEQLGTHPLRGAIFESWVASEILKWRLNRGHPADLYGTPESSSSRTTVRRKAARLMAPEEARRHSPPRPGGRAHPGHRGQGSLLGSRPSGHDGSPHSARSPLEPFPIRPSDRGAPHGWTRLWVWYPRDRWSWVQRNRHWAPSHLPAPHPPSRIGWRIQITTWK